VPDKKIGSCRDPELPGTGLQEGADVGNMTRDREKPIRDMMQEDQRPTEWEDYLFTIYICNKWLVTGHHPVTSIFSFRRIYHLVLHHLHWSSVNTQAVYCGPNSEYEERFSKLNKNCKIFRIANTPHRPSQIFLLLEPDFADNTCPTAAVSPNGINWGGMGAAETPLLVFFLQTLFFQYTFNSFIKYNKKTIRDIKRLSLAA
jgi:hypothetical protein